MKRCPAVTSPARRPCARRSTSTTRPSNRHRMLCSGRTQRSALAAPAHRLRPRERLDRPRDDSPAAPRGGAARDRARAGSSSRPRRRAHLERGERVDAGRLHEAFERALRRADVRAFAFLGDVGLARRQPVDHERRAAAASRTPRRVRTRAARRRASRRSSRADRSAARGLHARGNLFGEQLEQKLGHVQSPLRACARASASQQRFRERAHAADVGSAARSR